MDESATIEDIVEVRSGISRVFEEIVEQRRTTAGVHVSPEAALQSSAVLACVRVIAESVASLDFNLYRKLPGGGKQIAEAMPLNKILAQQPNSWMTAYEFKELMQTWLLLWGNAYAEIRPGRLGSVTELWPLHPSKMSIEKLQNGRLRYTYRDTEGREEKTYSQDQIYHLRWLTKDGFTGYVPTTLCREAIGLARATELHSSAFFGNGASPGIILESDQPLKPETAQRLRQSWEDIHKGPGKNAKTAVLPHGIKAKELSGSNDSDRLLETRRFQVEEIARAFRVPVYMIGDLTKSSYSSVEQQGLDFVTFTLVPHLKRWEGAVARDLIVDDDNYFAQFDVRGLMRGDNVSRAQYLRELWNLGVLSINEIRASEGMNPIEEGDKRFVQVNMALLESFQVQPPEEEEEPEGEEEKPQEDAGDAGSEGQEEAPAEAETQPEVDQAQPEAEPARSEPVSAAELFFRQSLRRLAALEADGILERRGKPSKIAAWLESHEARMRLELVDAAEATGRQIEDFVQDWMNGTREALLECHRNGTDYEEATRSWQTRVSETLSAG